MFVVDGGGVFFGTCDKKSLIAAAKAPSCAGWQLYPAAQRGVQATARDPKPNEGDRSPTAQEKKKK